MIVERWTKSCACKGATATTGQVRIEAEPDENMVAIYTPGLSCDKCGKAWTYTRPAPGGEGEEGEK